MSAHRTPSSTSKSKEKMKAGGQITLPNILQPIVEASTQAE
jgi:hypothetical protein